jgi:hypothetical protein
MATNLHSKFCFSKMIHNIEPVFCSHTRTFSHGLNSADKDENRCKYNKKKKKNKIKK